jgi:hypothetical protein
MIRPSEPPSDGQRSAYPRSNNEFAGPLAQALSVDVHRNSGGKDESFDEQIIPTNLRTRHQSIARANSNTALMSLTLVKPSFSIHGITAKLTPNAKVFLNAVKLVIDSPASGR